MLVHSIYNASIYTSLYRYQYIYISLYSTRTNEELDNFFLNGENDFRVDFLRIDSKITSPWGRKLQQWTPKSLRFLVNPILSLLFDKKLVNIDREHFKSCIRENMGLVTFQEAFDRSGRIINITVSYNLYLYVYSTIIVQKLFKICLNLFNISIYINIYVHI